MQRGSEAEIYAIGWQAPRQPILGMVLAGEIDAVGSGSRATPVEWRNMMAPNITKHLAQARTARIAGGCYVVYILSMVLADVLGHIGRGDAQQISQAITANLGSFRLGLVVAFGSALLFLVTAWSLYVLLRPVDDQLALLFLLLNAVGVGIQCASQLALVAALLLGDGGMPAFSAAQQAGLAYLAIDAYRTGFVAAQLFFGAWLFPLGYLVYKSGFLPRLLGALLLLDGVAVMIWFLQALLLPAYHAISVPGLMVSFIAEVGLALWLLLRGVTVTTDPPPLAHHRV